MDKHPNDAATEPVTRMELIHGWKGLEPVQYRRRVERLGFMQWQWVIETDFSRMTNGPYLTRRGALKELARMPI